jgi:hypothetical protein
MQPERLSKWGLKRDIMRICNKCKEEKEDSYFPQRSGRPAGQLNRLCQACLQINLKEHRQHIRSIINRWKEWKGCSACGFKGSHYQLDLDHVDPSTKECSNHRAYEPNWSMKRVKQELAKCVILCANCHREKTFLNSDHLQVCDSPAHDKN